MKCCLGSATSLSHMCTLPKENAKWSRKRIMLHFFFVFFTALDWETCDYVSNMWNHKSLEFRKTLKIYFTSVIFFNYLFFQPSSEDMFIDFRERGKEEKYLSVVSRRPPNKGSNLQPRYVPWLESNPQLFGVWNVAPTTWTARPGQPLSFIDEKNDASEG